MQHCPNFNHRRSNPPVRGCPTCGGVVNTQIRAERCSDAEHASRRKNGDMFCTGCCLRLRT